MDTSETYIKMCETAEEIQQHSPRRDWLDIEFLVAPFCSPDGNFFMRKIAEERIYIWLPRQDQLQEMMANWNTPAEMFINGIPALTESDDYFSSLDESERNYYRTFFSWEQLWLAFCMSEKFNKIWDGENWIARQ